jgi:hypothetical protein
MDKETKVAYEIVRQRIVENLDRLEAAQKAKTKLPSGDINSLKKWRRFGAAFAWDPEFYSEVLEQPDISDAELISKLRKKEATFMRKWGVIDKIPLHHVIANRTGGDLGIRTPVDTWLETRQRVFDATGARPGNGQANLNAAGQFDELAHLGRIGAKGSVFEAAGKEVREDFPVLHRAGQKLADKAGADPKIVTGSAKEQAEILIPSVIQQQQRFAETTATPEVQAQRQVLTRAGYPEAFAPETPIERIQEIAAEIRGTEIPSQFAAAWEAKAGNLHFNAGLGPEAYQKLIAAAKETIKKPLGALAGAATMVEPEAVKSALEGKPLEAVKQTATGAVAGAVVEQIGRRVAPVAMRFIPKAGQMALGAVGSTVGAPLAAGYAGYELLNAIVEGATGKTLQETGQAAEQTKEELRQQGMSEYQLRKRARTGR